MNQEISQLAAEAAAMDAQAAAAIAPAIPQEGAAAAQVPVDPLAEARDLIRFAVGLFVPLYPSLAGVYTDQRQERLAAVAVPLMEKYNFTMSGFFEKWGPEVNFLIVAGPVAAETARAIRADTAARKAAAAEPEAPQANEQK